MHIHKQVRLQKYTFMDGLISGRFSVYKSGNFYLRTFLNKKGFYARIRRQSYEKDKQMIYGYVRVSSQSQNEDRQMRALLEFGVEEDKIICDKKSGKDLERDGYLFLKHHILRPGDTLVIKELDRLSRNKKDIKEELEYFNQNHIRIKVLDIPTTLFDFPEEQKWVMNMINNILIEVISSIAESERIKIRQRQREGIDAALQKGVKLGRVPLSKPDNWEAVMQRVENQEITAVEAMRILNMKKSSYYKMRKRYPPQ